MSDPNVILSTNKEKRQNDNRRKTLSGWRFIHHPKVKENRCYQRDTQASGSVRVLLELPTKETRWTSVSAKTLLG